MTHWVDEIRVQLTVDPKPTIELAKDLLPTVGGTWKKELPVYWVERGGSLENAGIEALEYLQAVPGPPYGAGDLAPVDITDQVVTTAWGRRAPEDVLAALAASSLTDPLVAETLAAAYPEFIVTDDLGTAADEVQKKFDEEWLGNPDEYIIAYSVVDRDGRVAEEKRRRVIVYEEGREWAEYNGHWYRLNPPAPYRDHRVQARAAGGYVAAITSEAENNWAFDTFMHPVSMKQRAYGFWCVLIGFTDEAVEGIWAWDSGEPIGDWLGWYTGEPNNAFLEGGWGPENYASISFGPVPGIPYTLPTELWHDIDDDACCPYPPFGAWMGEGTRYRHAILEAETNPLDADGDGVRDFYDTCQHEDVSGNDTDGDGCVDVTLADAIATLGILSGNQQATAGIPDVGRDGRIGLAEAIFALKAVLRK